jgi:hypothetical protein
MRQGFTTAQQSALRTRPQGAEWYLAIHKPRVVGTFSIVPAQFSGSVVAEVTVTQSGALTASPLAGMTGVVLDGTGNFIGDFRVRKNWTSNQLAIAESGSGLIDWKKGATIKILDQFRPWIKHPRYDTNASQWRMDFDVVYDGQLNSWGPYVNIGPPIVALPTSWVEWSGEGPSSSPIWVVDFWSDSVSLQSHIESGVWRFPDGQTVTSAIMGTSSAPIKMTFTGASPGGSYFTFTAVDGTGASHIGRRLIFALEDISQFPRVLTSTITGGVAQNGYQARFLASLGAGFATESEGLRLDSSYPWLENSEFIVYERAYYGASKMSIGGNYGHRESTIFRGWTKTADVRVGPFSSDMSIMAETVNGIIGESDSYDIFLANYQAGGSDWTEMQSLCIDGVAQFALKWRSTLGDICDWKPMGLLGTTEQILYQSLPRSPFFEQLRQNYGEKGVLGHIASDMQGNLHAFQDINISGLSSLFPLTTLQSGDIRDDITINTVPRDVNAQVSLYAVSSDIPYGAESPAHVRGYFGGERIFERGLLVDSQSRLIDWTGNYRAKLNSKYPVVNIPLSGNTRIDPVPQSIISLSLSGSQNARGISWQNKKFLPRDLNVTYDANAGYPMYDINVEELVNGIGGSSITFPTIDDIVPPPTLPPPPATVPVPVTPPTPIGFGTGFGTVYVLINNILYRTRDFSASSPVWVDVGPAVTGLNDFILDPWNPAKNGLLLGDDGVYRSTNLDQSSPTWNHILTKAQIESLIPEITTQATNMFKIVGSINVQGYFGFIGRWPQIDSNNSGGGFYCYTTDNGVTWSYSIILGNISSSGLTRHGYQSGALDIVPHLVGGNIVLYASMSRYLSSISSTNSIFRSTDGGATWTLLPFSMSLTGSNINGPCLVHCPYAGNQNGNLAYIGVTAANSTQYLYRYDGTTLSGIGVIKGGDAGIKRWMAEQNTLNQNAVYQWQPHPAGTLWVSNDSGDSWSEVTSSGILTSGITYASGGFPTNTNQFYLIRSRDLSTAGIYVSTDGGVNWVEKTGNISPLLASQFRSVIVPLWTE